MKLRSTLALHAEGETMRRDPGFWDRFKKLFGAKPNLETDRVRTNLSTAHLVQGIKQALQRLGVNNAVALVIDGHVLFEDRQGSADDLDDLYLAFYDNEAVHGREFKDLHLTVEHREAGLHVVLEIVGKGEHQLDEATAQVIVSARIHELEVRPGEDAAAYRRRVAPLVASPAFAETQRLHFESFLERVRDGLRAALPEVNVRQGETRALVEKPDQGRLPPATDAGDPRYDPYDHHMPSVSPELAALVFWSAMASWSWHPRYVVVDRHGAEVGTTDQLAPGGGSENEPGDGGDVGEVDFAMNEGGTSDWLDSDSSGEFDSDGGLASAGDDW